MDKDKVQKALRMHQLKPVPTRPPVWIEGRRKGEPPVWGDWHEQQRARLEKWAARKEWELDPRTKAEYAALQSGERAKTEASTLTEADLDKKVSGQWAINEMARKRFAPDLHDEGYDKSGVPREYEYWKFKTKEELDQYKKQFWLSDSQMELRMSPYKSPKGSFPFSDGDIAYAESEGFQRVYQGDSVKVDGRDYGTLFPMPKEWKGITVDSGLAGGSGTDEEQDALERLGLLKASVWRAGGAPDTKGITGGWSFGTQRQFRAERSSPNLYEEQDRYEQREIIGNSSGDVYGLWQKIEADRQRRLTRATEDLNEWKKTYKPSKKEQEDMLLNWDWESRHLASRADKPTLLSEPVKFMDVINARIAQEKMGLKSRGLSTDVVTLDDLAKVDPKGDNAMPAGIDPKTGLPTGELPPMVSDEQGNLIKPASESEAINPNTGLPYLPPPKPPAIIVDPQTGLPVGGGVVGEVRNLMEMRRELDRRKAAPSLPVPYRN